MSFIKLSQLHYRSNGTLMYLQPKEDWKNLKDTLSYMPKGATVSVVLTLGTDDGGVVKCRADISDITFSDDVPHLAFDDEDKVYFIIRLEDGYSYWAHYNFKNAQKPASERTSTYHGLVVYRGEDEFYELIAQEPTAA